MNLKGLQIQAYMLMMFGSILVSTWAFASDDEWGELLRQADAARGNLEGVVWSVELLSREDDAENELHFKVQARAFDILAEHVYPPREKGKKLIMINGNMWFYKPGLRKPIPISQRQKLMGNAAYGDIAATNYADDYDVLSVAEDTLNDQPCYKFELKSNNSKTTYDRINYWVEKERVVGIRAEYFTVSGKKFKIATMSYDNSLPVDDGVQPFISKMTIYDELMGDDVTTMEFSDANLSPIPDHVFNLNLLTR